jgi:[histone H3]-lysine4 N-trimethyltransferase SETD1
MLLIDDKDSIKASRSMGSPPRRKAPAPKKTVEEEAVEAILAELKEVFMKDVRSRIVNPTLSELLDPSHYRDIQPKSSLLKAIVQPDVPVKVQLTAIKQEPNIPLNLQAMTTLLPRFRKKGAEPTKVDSDRQPTKADLRPMHHQFNYYSDSDEEDEHARREPSISDDEEESSRPSRETTGVSTPEPSRVKGLAKSILRQKAQDDESENDFAKEIVETTITAIPSKRKRVIDFTSSEEDEEPTPSKKARVPAVPEPVQIEEPVVLDEVAPKLSRAAIIKAAKAKAAAIRRLKRQEAKAKTPEDSIVVEETPMEEIIVPSPVKFILDVNLEDTEDDDELLLDLDGVQALVRDTEDYRYLVEALADEVPEPMDDIFTWSWKEKKLRAQNLDGQTGPIKIPEPPSYNRVNLTGCARTEGYIKIPDAEKSLYLPQRNKAIIPIGSETARKTSRMNRVNNRRLAADMEVQKKTLSTESDILRFNQLKARKKQLKFARSPIHDWGLFAMEDIEAHEMVIEYVGEIVRFQVAELREKQYERVGIGSSYLFRVDDENIIDGMPRVKGVNGSDEDGEYRAVYQSLLHTEL